MFIPMPTLRYNFLPFIEDPFVLRNSDQRLLGDAEIASSGASSVRVGLSCNSPFDGVADSYVMQAPDEFGELAALLVSPVSE